MKTDWLKMEHEVPKGMEKFLNMLCEAGDASNELKLLTRYQKIVRAIHDEVVAQKDKEINQLKELGKFGMNCLQDSFENAYVEHSVMDEYRKIATSGCMYSQPCVCCQDKVERAEEFQALKDKEWKDKLSK